MEPEWTVTNLLIQILAGIAGAHAAAIASHEHRFGFIGHSVAGLLAGAFSGFFFQVLAMTVVSGGGNTMPVSRVEAVIIQVMTGAAAGAIVMFVIGFVRHEMSKPQSE